MWYVTFHGGDAPEINQVYGYQDDGTLITAAHKSMDEIMKIVREV